MNRTNDSNSICSLHSHINGDLENNRTDTNHPNLLCGSGGWKMCDCKHHNQIRIFHVNQCSPQKVWASFCQTNSQPFSFLILSCYYSWKKGFWFVFSFSEQPQHLNGASLVSVLNGILQSKKRNKRSSMLRWDPKAKTNTFTKLKFPWG